MGKLIYIAVNSVVSLGNLIVITLINASWNSPSHGNFASFRIFITTVLHHKHKYQTVYEDCVQVVFNMPALKPTHNHTYTHIQVFLCVRVCLCIYIPIYIYVCVCVCVRTQETPQDAHASHTKTPQRTHSRGADDRTEGCKQTPRNRRLWGRMNDPPLLIYAVSSGLFIL